MHRITSSHSLCSISSIYSYQYYSLTISMFTSIWQRILNLSPNGNMSHLSRRQAEGSSNVNKPLLLTSEMDVEDCHNWTFHSKHEQNFFIIQISKLTQMVHRYNPTPFIVTDLRSIAITTAPVWGPSRCQGPRKLYGASGKSRILTNTLNSRQLYLKIKFQPKALLCP
jgi:hypothetical protein